MNDNYYRGMKDGILKCLRMMTKLCEATAKRKDIEARYLIARTAESMEKLLNKPEFQSLDKNKTRKEN
jgi:hypothetical protein